MSYENRDYGKVVGIVKVPTEITDYDIDCILAGCFEGGSNYWIDTIEALNGDYKGKEFASEVIGADGMLYITHDGSKAILTRFRFLIGLHLYYKLNRKPVAIEDMDAGDYDCVLQYALFGKLVYG